MIEIDLHDSRRVIEDTIRDRLSTEAVERVLVRDGEDNDGDPVLRITVVLKKPLRAVNRREMIGLTRHIRTALKDNNRYPLIEFLSLGDAKKRAAA